VQVLALQLCNVLPMAPGNLGRKQSAIPCASQIADYSKHSIEQGSKTLEKLLRAKSPDKAFEVQTEYAKAAYEGYVSHATKLGQLYAELAQETFKSYQDFASKLTPVR
jgi:hypothetical protein